MKPNSKPVPSLKICGITRQSDLDYCVRKRVEFVGFNFYRGSRRYIQPEMAARLWGNRFFSGGPESGQGLKTTPVGVVVDPSFAEITGIFAEFPDLAILQFHGFEPPDVLSWVHQQWPEVKIWRAVPVAGEADIDGGISRWRDQCVDLVLFDASTPAAHSYGGEGRRFEWNLLKNISGDFTFGVAGGITAAAIPELLKLSRESPGIGCTLIDVASGVESIPGTKDEMMMSEFISRLRAEGE